MNQLLVLSAALLLVGCCTPVPPIERTTTVEVKVPVIVPIPEPKAVIRPQLMIYQLVPADVNEPGKVISYYQASIKQLQGYAIELETILDGYRNNGAILKQTTQLPK